MGAGVLGSGLVQVKGKTNLKPRDITGWETLENN